ncbi:hypothetical protein SPBR_08705 [Sporothrix brasiliensis 5110]|uniref:Glycosyltransferase family 28 N-terminal domain-containing protein n=1 Tax=Sporothrix brasiliensis 5110 TaxID=1398154 RepID=A0A0C2IAV7_9PEZI|nr:uncharacterized protein SPBR_08705 [Sporothrix brasiliensis 5110]KIH86386.1 hypothetical protein SPBR_08705 [Sporothrix brasiliensis 5110]
MDSMDDRSEDGRDRSSTELPPAPYSFYDKLGDALTADWNPREHGLQGLQESPPDFNTAIVSAVERSDTPCPPNIVVQIVGSCGVVQSFVALGTTLKRYGHRVRIAAHNESIDGDPAYLMDSMVKNPGLLPQVKTSREG